MAINYKNLRKVLFTVDEAYDDAQMIITDAPKEAIERWCRRWNKLYENEECSMLTSFDTLKAAYYVKEIDISDEEFYDELITAIGFDEVYDYSDYYEYSKEEEPETVKQFTDDEMYILSDGLLSLIRNTNKAIELTSDSESINKLKETLKKYKELNTKVCKYLE